MKKIILSYIKEHAYLAGIYGAITGILFAVAALYGYRDSMEHMAYAVFLIAFFGLCAGALDCMRYIKKCRELFDASVKSGERDAYLPSCKSLPEEYYQDMIRREEEEKRRLLSEYDEKKKDMADYYTMWTHQIKTPIAAMRLLLQREGEISGQALEELFKIEQYAEMALHYARLDSLSSDLLLKSCDICGIVRQAVKKYAILFIGSGLSFSMEECVCQAVTDEKWLSFCVEQILSNALKYTRQGKISIYGLDRERQKTNGQAVYLVIEDTGIGIGESDLPRIFERGFTGYNGRLDKRSTGIGLYLTKQITGRLSHSIEVTSRPGEGTKVTLGFADQKKVRE